MMSIEAITMALQDQEDRSAALVDRVDRLEAAVTALNEALQRTCQAVTNPEDGRLYVVPFGLL